MTVRLAVVTVTYSPGDYLDNFLRTLPEIDGVRPPVIIADNGSVDGAPERAVETWPNATLVDTGGNIGYGGGMNRGVAELDDDIEFLVIANPDIEWTDDCLDELLVAAQRWPRAGALGPKILETDGSVYPSARRVPTLGAGTGHALLGVVWKSNPWTTRYRNELADQRERPVGWLSGSCLLLRRAAFESVDGFDSRYFMFFEDVDLGDRLSRAGWLNVYVPSAVATHAKSHSVSRHPDKMIPAHHRSAYRFLADRNRGPLRLPLRLALRAGLATRSAISVAVATRKLRAEQA